MNFVSYLIALVLTLIIEISIAYFLGCKTIRGVVKIIMINLITHPLLWYLLWINNIAEIFDVDYILILFLEILIILVEAFLLNIAFGQYFLKSLKNSFIINSASFLTSFIIFLPFFKNLADKIKL